jgi:hypothetical protein
LGEYSDIIITIKDSAGNTVEDYSGLINLTITSPDSGQGTVASETLNYPTQNTTIFTAVSAGEVNITATSDVEEELSPDTVTVYISEGRKIELTALPNKIMADGNDPSIITAVIKDMDGDIVTDEDYQIVFEILSGNGNLSDIIETTVNGVATTSLTSTSELDVITVIARGMDLTPASVTVQTTYSKSIFLSADNWLYITEQAGISIDVVNSLGDSVAYSGYIDLTLSDYELGSITPETLYYTTQQNALFTPLSTGEVTITANGEGINSDSITIQILGVEETILILADNITVSSDGVYEIITFDISIWGELDQQ